MPNNHSFVKINTLNDAYDAWESFFGRFFSPEIPSGVSCALNPDLRQFIPRAQKDAKYKHPGFKDKATEQFPIDQDRTLHSDDFDDFLNGNTVTIPDDITLHEEGLDQVANAIKNGDFGHEALKKKDHLFYALWLFKQNKISRQQMTTLLARAQISSRYPIVETFRIFDTMGNLTEEAYELWLPAIKKSWYGKSFTEEHLEQLVQLILAAPKSEHIFFISKINPRIVSVSPTNHELGNALDANNAWHRATYKEEQYELHFSFGVIDALQIITSGINGAAACRAKLGTIGIDAIKEGVESYYRPTAISMPHSGVDATTKGIHGYGYTPMPAVTAHDVFHSKLHNTIFPEFHMMLNHMNQIISRYTGQKWSKIMWNLVDREFHAFQHQDISLNSPRDGAWLFMKMLHPNLRIMHYPDYNDSAYILFTDREFPRLSDEGVAIVWNMVNEPDIWKKLYKIDIDTLSFPYRGFIHKMREFKQKIDSKQKHSSELLTLKYRYFRVSSESEFQRICKVLDSLEDTLVSGKDQKDTTKNQQLVFGKYTEGPNKNTIILKFKNKGKEKLISESSVKKLIPAFVSMHLITKFGEKEEQAVLNGLENISKEFKSIHQNSQFSKELLENTLATLPSITAQLDFLEACYERITDSKAYVRRYATADALFSFFKNPLTTSQREHIALLKEKLNEIVDEYQKANKLNGEEIKELQWYMNNRGSNLSLCNTDRFYLHSDSGPQNKL